MSGTSVGVQFNPSTQPGIRLALDPSDPERLFLEPRLHFGRLVLGLLVVGFASYGQIDAWSNHEWASFLFATLAALGGVALLTLRRRTVLDRGEATVEIVRDAVGLPHFRKTQTLANFDRVTVALGEQLSSKGGSTTYPVSLEGKANKILLDEPGYWEPARNLAEEIAAFLQLPLHDANRSGKLQPEEFDQTVGRRTRHVNPVKEPRTLACQVEVDTDELLRIRIPPPDYRPFLVIAVIVGLFFLIPLTIELFLPLLSGRHVDLLSVAIPVVLPLWVFYEMAHAVLTNGGLLEVTPGTFRMTQTLPWGVRTIAIPASELEDLVILDPEMGGPRTMLAHFTHGVLVARSDRESVRLGYGLTRVELLWLRARIIRVLGGRGDQAPRPKRHATAGRSLRPALIGLTFGIVVAHVARGPLAPCLALPFLQHVVSVGAALGLIAGLLPGARQK